MRSSVIESRRRFLFVFRRSRGRKREFCRARRGKNVVLLLFLLFVVFSVLLLLLLKHTTSFFFLLFFSLFFFMFMSINP